MRLRASPILIIIISTRPKAYYYYHYHYHHPIVYCFKKQKWIVSMVIDCRRIFSPNPEKLD